MLVVSARLSERTLVVDEVISYCFEIWTNLFCNFDKYVLRFGQICFKTWTKICWWPVRKTLVVDEMVRYCSDETTQDIFPQIKSFV